MLLSKLEINGFKSFPDRTILEFNGGITGVVGPNGCGKSNILDSIRWVLGEQRTSVLRSSKMEEVIFSGTNTLKPTGMAEVNLTIKNNRGVLPIEYDKVIITRRIFRSGESEYYLNKNRCRLKDIMELFYDTGMGPHAYSVIQQGMIDAILSDKTEDRRSLFEEAAGVTKYKYRKKEAENKLQATEADLLRLGDVIAEIEKQVVQLRRQAKRANRYSARKNVLKDIELTLAAGLLYESQERYKKLHDEKHDLEIEIESSTADLDKLEIEIQDLKLNLSEKESEESRFRQEESRLSLKAAEIESDIKLCNQRAESATGEIERRKSEITNLRSRIESLKSEIENSDKRKSEIEVEKTEVHDQSESTENELSGLLERLSEAESDLEQKRKVYNDTAGEISGIRAEIMSLEEMRKSLSGKREETEQNAREFDESKNKDNYNIENLNNLRKELIDRIDQLKSDQGLAEHEIALIDKTVSDLRENISAKKAELSGLKARKEILEQLVESGEGYSGGAKAIRAWAEKPDGILMPVAEVLEVPEQYRVAVNAALGDMGEIIPTANFDYAMKAIEYLKANNAGRATFIALDRLSEESGDNSRPKNAGGFIGYISELVKYPDEYKTVVKLLLNRVALFESESAASNAGSEWRFITRVTRDGLVLLPSNMVSGGKAVTGILGRKQDLELISGNLDRSTAELRDLESSLAGESGKLDRLRTTFEENKKEIASFETDKSRVEAELTQLRFDFRQKESEHSAAVNQVSRLSDDIRQYEDRLSNLNNSLRSGQDRLESAGAEVDKASQIVEGLKADVKQIEGRLTASRIRSVELDGMGARIDSEIEHAKEMIAEAERLINAHEDGIVTAQTNIENSLKKIDELKGDLEVYFSDRSKAKEKLLEVEGIISEKTGEIGVIEKQAIEKRKLKENNLSTLHNLDMRLVELDSKRNSITEKIRFEFGVSNIEPADLPEDQAIDSLKERAEKIRQELQRMEPVNLMAAEDYERENDRYNFLMRQREDLLDAKASLKEAITRINTTAEERFNSTFSKIEGNYQQVFSTLFENGEAHIALEDPSQPLESGIKIMARPGGKKLLSVAQLSGGERALTAISLLFAIYLVKPSPFCILDEVDAPLDDINLVRFLKLIKNFSKDTQFIIITHNKLTMEASDILYGVTMENPGVSKVVSVKFGGGNGNGDGTNN